MNCVAKAVGQTRTQAYAHHIQRLMVTGNFALLAGIDPAQVHEWYLAVYADAFEWVEAPNTIGMSQFADGGVIASKPYVSSGAYINRMSDHCKSCHYSVSAKTGDTACPFQPALLALSGPPSRPVLEQSAHGQYVPHVGPDGRRQNVRQFWPKAMPCSPVWTRAR